MDGSALDADGAHDSIVCTARGRGSGIGPPADSDGTGLRWAPRLRQPPRHADGSAPGTGSGRELAILIPGERAPDFELPDQHGGHIRLSTLLPDGPVVLFFYPAAMSRGCTAESCHFRDLAQEFRALHATRVGISQDDISTQQRFDQAHDLGYPCSPTTTEPSRPRTESGGGSRRCCRFAASPS